MTGNETRRKFDGKIYEIYDAYPNREGARDAAKDLRTFQGRVHKDHFTLARTVDLGVNAGRLRYAVYIAKGKPIDAAWAKVLK